MYPSIALIGPARSGKDSVAEALSETHTRVAFADPLKEMALRVNPVIPGWIKLGWDGTYRLSDAVTDVGWERTKEDHPEVRRFLQKLGHQVRQGDPMYWVRQAFARIEATRGPVVITDCRYRNEADALRMLGFKLIRVIRPGITGAGHVSETELTHYITDAAILNDGDMDDLRCRAQMMLDHLL
ncbi:hypothetical protein ACQEU8_02430 [Streptomyces sp. CA-250714]|uniref:deoxynucleotide monophosphate kinase family protein n=1 Tax=Streptomyces sp. CA-250714 TaxID=3240060 RepID=UPI003D935E73